MLRSGFELKHAFIVSGEGIVAASMSLRVPLSTAAMSLPAAFCHVRPSSHGRPARSGVPVYPMSAPSETGHAAPRKIVRVCEMLWGGGKDTASI
jgi:hypothetical protein